MYESKYEWLYSEQMWERLCEVWCSDCEELEYESDTGEYVCPCMNDVTDSQCPHWSAAYDIMEAQEKFEGVLGRYVNE